MTRFLPKALLCTTMLFLPSGLCGQGFDLVLEIGTGSASPESSFGRLIGVCGASDGRVYALDAMDNVVKAFDQEGHFLFAFGGQGQGPGEMMHAVGLRIIGDRIEVNDALLNRVLRFSLDGDLIETVSLDTDVRLPEFHLFGNGWVVGRTVAEVNSLQAQDSVQQAVVAFRRDGLEVDTIALGTASTGVWSTEQGDLRVYHAFPTPFGDQLNWAALGDSAFVVTDGYAGTAQLYSVSQGHPRLRGGFDLGVRGRERSEKDLRAAFERAMQGRQGRAPRRPDFTGPSQWSPITAILRDDSQRYWVGGELDPDGASRNWMVFSEDFSPLGSIEAPGRFALTCLKGALAYGVATDAFDVTYVAVYEVTWD